MGLGFYPPTCNYFYLKILWEITDGSPAKAVTEICRKDIKNFWLLDFSFFFTLMKLECFLECSDDISCYKWISRINGPIKPGEGLVWAANLPKHFK